MYHLHRIIYNILNAIAMFLSLLLVKDLIVLSATSNYLDFTIPKSGIHHISQSLTYINLVIPC